MAPPPGPVDNLPVFATVNLAYRSVFTELTGFARAAFLPLLLSILLAVPAQALSANPPFALVFGLLAVAVPYTLFGVSWYRLLLLGPAEPAPALFPRWGLRHWRFFRYALLLLLAGQMIMTLVMSQVASSLPQEGAVPAQANPGLLLGALVILLIVSTIMLRLSLVFPATAVDEAYGLAYSWRHTRGQGLRLLGATMLALLPLVMGGSILLAALVGGAQAGGASGATALVLIVESLVSYVTLGVTMAIIAAAFRTCAGWIPSSSGLPARPEEPRGEDDADET